MTATAPELHSDARIDSREFGLDGNASNDATGGWATAAAQLPSGASLLLHRGTHNIATPSTFQKGASLLGDASGPNGTILNSVGGAPIARIIGDGTSNAVNGQIKHLHFTAQADVPYSTPLLYIERMTGLSIEDLTANITTEGTLVGMDGCFLDSLDGWNLRCRRYMPPLEATNTKALGVQKDTRRIGIIINNGTVGPLWARRPGSTSDDHGFQVWYKGVCNGGDPDWGANASGALVDGTARGEKVWRVGSTLAAAAVIGDPVTVFGNPYTFEVVGKVTAIDIPGGTITSNQAARFPHGVGEYVQLHGYQQMWPDNVSGMSITGHHEKTAEGIILHGGTQIQVGGSPGGGVAYFKGGDSLVTLVGNSPAVVIGEVTHSGTNAVSLLAHDVSGGTTDTITIQPSSSGFDQKAKFTVGSTVTLEPDLPAAETLTVRDYPGAFQIRFTTQIARTHLTGASVQGRQANTNVRVPAFRGASTTTTSALSAASDDKTVRVALGGQFADGQKLSLDGGGVSPETKQISADGCGQMTLVSQAGAVLTVIAGAGLAQNGDLVHIGSDTKTVLSSDPVAQTITLAAAPATTYPAGTRVIVDRVNFTSGVAFDHPSGVTLQAIAPTPTFDMTRQQGASSGAPTYLELDDPDGIMDNQAWHAMRRGPNGIAQHVRNIPSSVDPATMFEEFRIANAAVARSYYGGRRSMFVGSVKNTPGTEAWIESTTAGVLRVYGNSSQGAALSVGGDAGRITVGTSSPEGVLAGALGDRYVRVDAPTPDKMEYRKTTGTTSAPTTTGWVQSGAGLRTGSLTWATPPTIAAGGTTTVTVSVTGALQNQRVDGVQLQQAAASGTFSITNGQVAVTGITGSGWANGQLVTGTGIPAGTTLSGYNSGAGTATLSNPATATNATATVVGYTGAPVGLVAMGQVTALNTVTVVFWNTTGSPITPPANSLVNADVRLS